MSGIIGKTGVMEAMDSIFFHYSLQLFPCTRVYVNKKWNFMTESFKYFHSLKISNRLDCESKLSHQCLLIRSLIRTFATRNWCCSDAVPISG